DGVLMLRCSGGAPRVEEWHVRPVVAVLQARQKTLWEFHLTRDRDFFDLLYRAGGETALIVEPFQPWRDGEQFSDGISRRSRDADPLLGAGANVLVAPVIKVEIGVEFIGRSQQNRCVV